MLRKCLFIFIQIVNTYKLHIIVRTDRMEVPICPNRNIKNLFISQNLPHFVTLYENKPPLITKCYRASYTLSRLGYGVLSVKISMSNWFFDVLRYSLASPFVLWFNGRSSINATVCLFRERNQPRLSNSLSVSGT